jgi:hypothetical protein
MARSADRYLAAPRLPHLGKPARLDIGSAACSKLEIMLFQRVQLIPAVTNAPVHVSQQSHTFPSITLLGHLLSISNRPSQTEYANLLHFT